MSAPRSRAAAVVLDGECVLVIRRERSGQHYAVLPGGGIEADETAAEACVRELVEETGLRGSIRSELLGDATVSYFLVDAHGTPQLGGPERDRSTADNVYVPCWESIADIERLGLVPESAVAAVRSAAR